MNIKNIRTDLTAEIQQIQNLGPDDGVQDEEDCVRGIPVHRTKILSAEAAERFGKPEGQYTAVDFSGAFRDDDVYTAAIQTVADEIESFIGSDMTGAVLVVGLGNAAMTSDSVGTKTADGLIVTRHIKNNLPRLFSSLPLRDVSVIKPGVLGKTGIESSDVINSVVRSTHPSAVVVIDSLSARNPKRICSTVQMSDSGICPGSGVGNTRAEISRRTLGVPVLALGVPTVVSAVTLSADMMQRLTDNLRNARTSADKKLSAALEDLHDGDFYELLLPLVSPSESTMTVTPGDVDALTAKVARLLSTAINKALHGDLSQEQINALLNV